MHTALSTPNKGSFACLFEVLGVWEIAQQEREVLCKREDRSQMPRTHINARRAWWVTCDPVLYSSNKLTRARWPARLANGMPWSQVGDPMSVYKVENNQLLHICTPIYTHGSMHVCMHTQHTFQKKKVLGLTKWFDR